METSTTLQIVVAVVTVLSSGISVYVGLKIANSENRKDVTFLYRLMDKVTKDVEKLDAEFNHHTDAAAHPTRDQLRILEAGHARLEAKLDRLLERLQ